MKFEGFSEPTENWSKLPHTLIANLHKMTSESEVKIVLYILRHTWGYHDDQKKITIDEFSHGRKRKDGSRLDSGTGLSENSGRAGIEKATEHGFIEVAEDSTDKARIKRYYQLKTVPELEVQKLNPYPSKVEPHDSTFAPRSEKETLREKPIEKTSPTSKKLPVAKNNTPGPFTQRLLDLCRLNFDTMTKRQDEQFREVVQLLLNNNATVEKLGYFERYWRSEDWRGESGKSPTLNQVCELWRQFEEWEKEHIRDGRAVYKMYAIDQDYKNDPYYIKHGVVKIT